MSRLVLRCGNGGRCSRSLRRQERRAASIWLRSCRVVVRQSNYSLASTVYKTQSRPSHPRPTIPCPIYIFALIARITHPNPRNHSEVNFPAPPSLSLPSAPPILPLPNLFTMPSRAPRGAFEPLGVQITIPVKLSAARRHVRARDRARRDQKCNRRRRVDTITTGAARPASPRRTRPACR